MYRTKVRSHAQVFCNPMQKERFDRGTLPVAITRPLRDMDYFSSIFAEKSSILAKKSSIYPQKTPSLKAKKWF